MFRLVCAGWACCHISCARNYWVVVYYMGPRWCGIVGQHGFLDDPGPRIYLSLS